MGFLHSVSNSNKLIEPKEGSWEFLIYSHETGKTRVQPFWKSAWERP